MQTYIHRFIEGTDPQRAPLLLLHRTGGSENDLVDDAAKTSPGAALLALRGNVLEDGKPRFFKRLAKGKFDLEDLALRTRELADFIVWARMTYRCAPPILFGFSNGANIAMSLLLARPDVARAAVLLRPMWAYEPPLPRDLNGFPVLVIGGQEDTTVVPELTERLVEFLRKAGAAVTLKWARGAHEITEDDKIFAAAWIAKFAATDVAN